MIDVASLSPAAKAGVLISAVLSEAIILYVGYGGLTAALGPSVKTALGGE